jgi:hypothetical protein
MPSIAHVRGTIAGAAILTLFGAMWYILALALWPPHPAWSIPAGCAAAIALLAFAVVRFTALRGVPSVDDPVAAAQGKRDGIWFGIIFGIEGLSIGLCAGLLAHFGLADWIPIAAGIIVGLHFLPLARLFQVPLYYWTGALCVLGLLACSLIGNATIRVLSAGLIMAAVLWLTSLLVLLRTRPTSVN